MIKVSFVLSIIVIISLFLLKNKCYSLESEIASYSPIPLAWEDSDIKPDKRLEWGLLSNGMRYVLVNNKTIPNKISLRLFVEAGSLMETKSQRGIAHFLEHMAFNGTKNFPSKEMVEYFQRLGMGFGNHTNAHTSFNETVYKLELQENNITMLKEAFKFLRDCADGMLLQDEEINSERGVILSEKRSRDSVEIRLFESQLKFYFPEVLISSRLPIGVKETINKFSRKDFLDFYNKWYTPNRMALVVVGDIDKLNVKSAIKDQFGDMLKKHKVPSPIIGNLLNRKSGIYYKFEPDLGVTSISIRAIKPIINFKDDSNYRIKELQLYLASSILEKRLYRISKLDNSSFHSSHVYTGNVYNLNFALSSSLSVKCSPNNWKASLHVLEQELRRVLKFGFTNLEIEEAKKEVLLYYKNIFKSEETNYAKDMANRIVKALGSRRVISHPEQDLIQAKKDLKKITAISCHEVFKSIWETSQENLILVSGNLELKNDPLKNIKLEYDKSLKFSVTPPVELNNEPFKYLNFSKKGKILTRKEIQDIKATQIVFYNNVRLNIKETKFKKNEVNLKIRFGSGLITEPKEGLAITLNNVFIEGGLQGHTYEEIMRLFSDKTVEYKFRVEEDAFSFSANTNSEDLYDQLVLFRAYFTNPGFKKESMTNFHKNLDGIYNIINNNPRGILSSEVEKFIHSNDFRFGYPSKDKIKSIKINDIKTWIEPYLDNGYIEITIVGDISADKCIENVKDTFGSLSLRKLNKPKLKDKRGVNFPNDYLGKEKTFYFNSKIQKGLVAIYWPTDDIYDIKLYRKLQILSSVFKDRLRIKIREKLGSSYSPISTNYASNTWVNYGYLLSFVVINPIQSESIAKAILEISKELSTGESITEDEFQRAKKPIIYEIKKIKLQNAYWLRDVLESSQEYPQIIEWSKSFIKDYMDINLSDINYVAKKYVIPSKSVKIKILPKN